MRITVSRMTTSRVMRKMRASKMMRMREGKAGMTKCRE